jgi:hypothetical protein
LRNSYKVIAAYLIEASGALKRVKRWPEEFGRW